MTNPAAPPAPADDRQHTLPPEVAAQPLTICGAGTLGGNLAEMLARMGFARLTVIDRDQVEMRNLSTQPYLRGEVGADKARALANLLYRAVQARVEPQVAELTAANAEELLRGAALVVDAFDNHAARAAVSAASLRLGLPCLHIGFSPGGQYGSGLWEPEYQVPKDAAADPCEYPVTRPLALTIVALAARASLQHFIDDRREHFELTWLDLQVSHYPAP